MIEKRCGTCGWGELRKTMFDGQMVRCQFPLPSWVAYRVQNAERGGDPTWMATDDGNICPTWKPREP